MSNDGRKRCSGKIALPFSDNIIDDNLTRFAIISIFLLYFDLDDNALHTQTYDDINIFRRGRLASPSSLLLPYIIIIQFIPFLFFYLCL